VTAVPVEIALRGEPAEAAAAGERADVEEAAAAAVDEVLDGLGIAGRAQVRVTDAGAAGDLGPARDVEVRVHGRLCRYSDVLVRLVAGAIRGAPVDAVAPPPMGGDVPRFTALVAREAIKHQPRVLLGEDQVEACAKALTGLGVPERTCAPDRLRPVLRDIVRLWVSIGRHEEMAEVLREAGEAPHHELREGLLSALVARQIEVMVPEKYKPLLGSGESGSADDLLGFAAAGLYEELGLVLPRFTDTSADGLPPGTVAFRLNDLVTLPSPTLGDDECLVNDAPERLQWLDLGGSGALNPATAQQNTVLDVSHKERLEEFGFTTWDAPGFVILALASAVRLRAGFFVDADKLDAQLDVLRTDLPVLVSAVRERFTSAELAGVVRALVMEQVPVRDLAQVLERLVDADYMAAPEARYTVLDDPVGAWHANGTPPESARAEFVRAGLRRRITNGNARGTKTLVAYLLDPEIEGLFHAGGNGWEPAEEDVSRVIDAVAREVAELPSPAFLPVVLCAAHARRPLREAIRASFPRLAVMTYAEVPPDVNVQPIARIALS
jgi:flagellar biosynthesis component FlhA